MKMMSLLIAVFVMSGEAFAEEKPNYCEKYDKLVLDTVSKQLKYPVTHQTQLNGLRGISHLDKIMIITDLEFQLKTTVNQKIRDEWVFDMSFTVGELVEVLCTHLK